MGMQPRLPRGHTLVPSSASEDARAVAMKLAGPDANAVIDSATLAPAAYWASKIWVRLQSAKPRA